MIMKQTLKQLLKTITPSTLVSVRAKNVEDEFYFPLINYSTCDYTLNMMEDKYLDMKVNAIYTGVMNNEFVICIFIK